MSKHVPVYSINVPNGGIQQSVTVNNNTPIYSSYTGNLIGYGGIQIGTPNDAPSGHPNYGKSFHVIEYNPANNSFMGHNYKSYK